MKVLQGRNAVALYASTVPLSYGFLATTQLFIRLETAAEKGHAMTLMTATALLLDGVAVMWFPGLYGGGE
jgi:hypothetical protein